MAWKNHLLRFAHKYGCAAKIITTSVLNVVAPGSGALTELVEQAFDIAAETAQDQWEEQLLKTTQRNAAELDRLGLLVNLLATDLAKVCDKAQAFADQPEEIEDIIRRAISGDRSLSAGLRKLNDVSLSKAMSSNPEKHFLQTGELAVSLLPSVEARCESVMTHAVSETPAQRVRRLKTEAAEKQHEAAQLLEIYDYETAAQILERFSPGQIPFRNDALFHEVLAKRTKLRQLHQQITELYRTHRFTDPRLPTLLAKYLQLKPNDAGKRELAAEFPPPRRGTIIANSLGMQFAWVPPGTSWLGGGHGKAGTNQFTLPHALYCGIYPVTQAEWELVTGNNPSYFSRYGGGKEQVAGLSNAELKRFPVESVSWNNVQIFLDKLSERWKKDGLTYRLPSEQEWEYVCRGGPLSQDESADDFCFARSKTDLRSQPMNHLSAQEANINNLLGRPCQAGLYLPNSLGVHDLHGNVFEWTSSSEGANRVFRGGSWCFGSANCTAASRSALGPGDRHVGVGFRLVAISAESFHDHE